MNNILQTSDEIKPETVPNYYTTDAMCNGELFDIAISAEGLAGHVYTAFAARFLRYPDIHALWKSMANDEATHRDRLYEVKTSLSPRHLNAPADPDLMIRMYVLEKARVKLDIEHVHDMKDAFALAHDFEYNEINNIFRLLIAMDAMNTHGEPGAVILRKHMATLKEIGGFASTEYRI